MDRIYKCPACNTTLERLVGKYWICTSEHQHVWFGTPHLLLTGLTDEHDRSLAIMLCDLLGQIDKLLKDKRETEHHQPTGANDDG